MDMSQMIPFPLAQMLGLTNGQPPQEPDITNILDPQILHTREQMRSLFEAINTAETLTKLPDRPEDEEGSPTVMVSDEQSSDAASAIIMHAANRLITIINDDKRWEHNPLGVPATQAEKKIATLQAENKLLQDQQQLKERQHTFAMSKKVDEAKVATFCKKIRAGEIPLVSNQGEETSVKEISTK